MSPYSRREFVKAGLAVGALASVGSLPLQAERRTATDMVTLGKSNVRVTRLAFGTGTMSGQVQRDLGQKQFTRLVRYAYERGIRFFETAESYDDMHRMLGDRVAGHAARQLPVDVEGDDHAGRECDGQDRRAAAAGEDGILRHYAAALAALGNVAGGYGAVAGRH